MSDDLTTNTSKDNRHFDFFMIDNEVIDILSLKAHSLALYVTIVRFANRNTDAAFPSIAKLAESSGMGEGTVRNHLDKLVEAGLISVTQRIRDDGSQTTNLYTLLDVKKKREGGGYQNR